jgi:hypothetical protein
MEHHINRCLGYNSYHKKCRTRIYDGRLFCCDAHKPINSEIEIDGCSLCIEPIHDTRDLHYFPCKHAFHKWCYNDWCKISTYRNSICMICRRDTPPFLTPPTKKKKKNRVIHSYEISFMAGATGGTASYGMSSMAGATGGTASYGMSSIAGATAPPIMMSEITNVTGAIGISMNHIYEISLILNK